MLRAFPAVRLAGRTTVPLAPAPAGRCPGGGGGGAPGDAAVEVHVQWDLAGGRLVAGVTAAQPSDNRSAIPDAAPPAGSLVVRGLGYFDPDRFAGFNAAGVFWPSRARADSVVLVEGRRHKLVGRLAAPPGDLVDLPIELCGRRVPCRRVARRVPGAVARRRHRAARRKSRKRYGRGPSGRQPRGREWTMLVTDLGAAEFDAAAVHAVYRVRRQVELLFELWKSHTTSPPTGRTTRPGNWSRCSRGCRA